MAYIAMACEVMAYMAMAYIAMAYIVYGPCYGLTVAQLACRCEDRRVSGHAERDAFAARLAPAVRVVDVHTLVTESVLMANMVMAYILMACIVMAYILMANIVMAYILMANIVMAYILLWPV